MKCKSFLELAVQAVSQETAVIGDAARTVHFVRFNDDKMSRADEKV